MSLLKSLYSIAILGFLFLIHLIKYPLRKLASRDDFIMRFKSDGIDRIDRERLDILFESANCISCNLCSGFNAVMGRSIDNPDICSRLIRDPMRFSYLSDKSHSIQDGVYSGDCPYGIDINRVSRLISR
jgi:hypothetical protein